MINTHLKIDKGFTLTELLVCMIVVAAMAGFALPRFNMHIEKTRSAEAVQILEALLKAQRAYFYENGAYTSTLTTLEINIPTTQSFNAPTVSTADPIASMARSNGAYTVRINANGTYSCVGASCGNLGF